MKKTGIILCLMIFIAGPLYSNSFADQSLEIERRPATEKNNENERSVTVNADGESEGCYMPEEKDDHLYDREDGKTIAETFGFDSGGKTKTPKKAKKIELIE